MWPTTYAMLRWFCLHMPSSSFDVLPCFATGLPFLKCSGVWINGHQMPIKCHQSSASQRLDGQLSRSREPRKWMERNLHDWHPKHCTSHQSMWSLFSIWNCLSGPGRLTPTSSRKQIFHAGCWSCRFGAARSTMQNVTRSPANCHVIQGAMLMGLVLPTAAPLLLIKAGSTGRDAVLRAWGR